MMETWEDLEYWRSGEWQWVQEKLDELDRKGHIYNPPRHLLFRPMDACPYRKVRVAILGQDPYPSRSHAVGIAFSIPETDDNFPPTLNNIFDELVADLGVGFPGHGNLIDWCNQGVFLWNSTPSCAMGKPGSHAWSEWDELTKEIVIRLNEKPIDVFVFMGNVAQKFAEFVTTSHTVVGSECNHIIYTSHPSPLGFMKGKKDFLWNDKLSRNTPKSPFKGSRVFSHINSYLDPPIDWRL